MAINFCSIASGSSGNSIYVGGVYTHILIDAGLSGKKITDGLKKINISGDKINAIFITHEHSDHIKGAGILSRRYNIPIYATAGTWIGMEEKLGDIEQENKRFVLKDEDCVIGDLCIHAYEIPHDANEPVGYSIMDGKNKVTVATDIGHITNIIKANIKGSNALLLEANHDVNMLKAGNYPYHLKRRILGKFGHLSNESSGNLLAEVVDGKLKHILLGHLSQENNFPDLAFETVAGILKTNGISLGSYLEMDMAPRYKCSDFINL